MGEAQTIEPYEIDPVPSIDESPMGSAANSTVPGAAPAPGGAPAPTDSTPKR